LEAITDNGNISWLSGDPENGKLTTISEILKENLGLAIGVVSTVEFSNATPAAFVSHNPNRNNGTVIADEIITSTIPEVVIGAGHPNYKGTLITPLYLSISSDSYHYLADGLSEYVFVERKPGKDGSAAILAGAEKAVAENKKLFGLFDGSNFDFDVPSNNPGNPQIEKGSPENPSLADAASAALKVLSQNRNGFFLMIEAGSIDRANSDNNFPDMVGAVNDLDLAVKRVNEFIEKPDDDITWENSIIIVTADHANSYMRLARDSKGLILLKKGDMPEDLKEFVSYQTTGHTNELVNIYAKGAGTSPDSAANLFKKYEGAWYPGTTIIDNTNIFQAICDFAEIIDCNL